MSLQQPFLKEPFTTLFHTFLRFSNFSGYNFFECFQRIIYCRKQFESKFRTVPHLFVFALSFQEQNLPRASFALAVKNASHAFFPRHLLGISLPNPSNHFASFAAVPACGTQSFDFPIKRKMFISP